MNQRYAWPRHVTGATLARVGDEMSGPALLLAGLAVSGSASAAGALLAAATVAAAVGGPVLGALLDRSPAPGRLLGLAVLGQGAALAAVVPALGAAPYAVAVLVAFGAGLLRPALSGGWTSQLPYVVPEKRLGRAATVDAMTFHVASLAGPALAAVVAARHGAAPGLLVAAALVCAAASVARWPGPGGGANSLRRYGSQKRRRPGETSRWRAAARPGGEVRRSVRALVRELGDGFAAVGRSRVLAGATVATTLSCAAEGLFVASLPVLGERVFGAAPHGVLLIAATALPALAANGVLARRPRLLHPERILTVTPLVLALAVMLTAVLDPLVVVLAMLLAGAAEGPQLAALFAIRHRAAPAGLRAQVFTTGASLKLAGYACGAAAAGPLSDRSLPGALLAAAGVHTLAALSAALLLARSRRAPTHRQSGRELA
ncbi:Major Facilitator Superfamily protein [Streptomyces sp. YIM 130001]|uniref:MFS transporter n=1 Tax=Streptomyces sp. YIM 130001 TaxID=2259644 RepID=UPI000E65AD8C|nr:MFS transporter [Streptomyces sp. YIM 130001]RII18691.1 Major Facilitator Superfamily protein [Streptomyces sp. YIM 130001]